MADVSLETLFRRFRKRGDVAALAQVFDRTGPELLRVAMHVARDAVEAEDLVQSTFLAAIEGANGFRRGRRLVPWLVGILARQAARARRAASRRPDQDRLHERPSAPDPIRALEDAELRDRCASALVALPPKYRDVLERHLLHGARPAEIAHELERAPGTVRMQISRGLKLLRRSLPEGCAAFGFADATRGQAAIKAQVLARAQVHASQLALAANTTAIGLTTIGGTFMSTKAGIGIVAVTVGLLVGGLSLQLSKTNGAPPTRATGGDAHAQSSAEPRLLAADQDEHATRDLVPTDSVRTSEGPLGPVANEDHATASTAPTKALPGIFLVAALVGLAPDSTTVPVIHVYAPRQDDSASSQEPDEEGRYIVDLTPLCASAPMDLYISVNHPAYGVVTEVLNVSREEFERAREERVDLVREWTLQPAARLNGRVVVPRGHDVRSVEIGLFELTPGAPPPLEPVRTAEIEEDDGSFSFEKRKPASYLVVAAADGLLAASVRVELAPLEVRELAPLVLRRGETRISGTLELAEGLPREDFVIQARSLDAADEDADESWRWIELSDGTPRTRLQSTRTDASGAFELAGLEPGPQRLTVAGKTMLGEIAVETFAPSTGVVLGQGLGRIRFDVRSADAPLAQAEIMLSGYGQLQFATGEDGSAEAWAPQALDLGLRVRKDGYADFEEELPAGARELDQRLIVELEPGTSHSATLVLEGRTLAPLPQRVRIELFPAEGSSVEHSGELVDGTYVVKRLEPGRFTVRVEPDEARLGPFYDSYLFFEQVHVELAPGERRRVPLVGELGGRLALTLEGTPRHEGESAACELRDAEGQAVFVRYVNHTYADNIIRIGAQTGGVPLNARCEAFPNLPLGSYSLYFEPAGTTPFERRFTIVAGQTTELTLQLRR